MDAIERCAIERRPRRDGGVEGRQPRRRPRGDREGRRPLARAPANRLHRPPPPRPRRHRGAVRGDTPRRRRLHSRRQGAPCGGGRPRRQPARRGPGYCRHARGHPARRRPMRLWPGESTEVRGGPGQRHRRAGARGDGTSDCRSPVSARRSWRSPVPTSCSTPSPRRPCSSPDIRLPCSTASPTESGELRRAARVATDLSRSQCAPRPAAERPWPRRDRPRTRRSWRRRGRA